jgi:hypothetical protein
MVFMGSRLTRAAACAAVAVVALVAAGTAAAPASGALGIACPDPTSKVFAPWNDWANYAYAPDGGVEARGAGWTLKGASVVSDNESFFVHGAADRFSLSLPAGSSATTAPMCVGILSGKMRFFARNSGSSKSQLRVQVVYLGGVGGLLGSVGKTLGVADVGYVTSGGSWQPSPEIPMLGGVLPLLTQAVQFRFTPADRSGNWRIDDVYLDPLKH